MKTPEEIKKALMYMSVTNVSEKSQLAKRGMPYAYIEDVARDALEYINELEAKAPRWISVNERLPEEDVWVLTRDIYGKIRNRSLYVLNDGTNMFWPDRLFPGKHIIHWMPMPEAPEEG